MQAMQVSVLVLVSVLGSDLNIQQLHNVELRFPATSDRRPRQTVESSVLTANDQAGRLHALLPARIVVQASRAPLQPHSPRPAVDTFFADTGN
jgi:hypothetical protein